MNKDEFKKFFKYVSSVTTDTNPSPERTQVYWDLLNDLDFKVAMAAGKKVLATLENPFLPMPAVFRSMALDVTGKKNRTEPEVWEEVTKAIRNYGFYREREALESLSPLTKRAVETFGFKELCHSENIDVIRGQFRMAYEALEKRESTEAKTPQALKQIITAMQEKILSEPKQLSKNKPEELEKLYL